MIVVSKRATKQQAKLVDAGYLLIDVTSTSKDATYQKFSPFYPHGNIPVPGTDLFSESVEGVWQGLKVFEKQGIDNKKFEIKTMKDVKRPANDKRGKVLGHQFEESILGYLESRKRIYLPTYEHVLDNCLAQELIFLKQLATENNNKLALIDYETNDDVENCKKPLSHASLVIKRLNEM